METPDQNVWCFVLPLDADMQFNVQTSYLLVAFCELQQFYYLEVYMICAA